MEEYVTKAEEILNKLALDVVMLEPDNVEGLGGILNHFDELIGLFEHAGKEIFVDLAQSLRSIAENLALQQYGGAESEQNIKRMEQGISLCQESLRDPDDEKACGRKFSEFVGACNDNAAGEQQDARPESEAADNASTDFFEDKELIESFVMESLEHLGTIEVNVLSLEQDPENVEVMNAIFRPFHTVKGVSGFLNLKDINRLAHEVETLLDDARNRKLAVDETITDLILDAVDLLKGMIDHVQQGLDTGKVGDADFGLDDFLDRLRRARPGEADAEVAEETIRHPKRDGADVGDILIEKGVVSEQVVAGALQRQTESGKRLGEILIEEKQTNAREVATALREQKRLRGDVPSVQKTAAFVKVDTQKLDNMVDMVGELVITQAMLGQDISALAVGNQRLFSNLSQLGRITSDIQRTSMSLRMVPIKQTFDKMIRLVRDLSKKSGKKVNLEMVGEDTEIDRNMVDEIHDPLVHMVRNSVDHGIEKPEDRKAAGKPESGTVKLKAYHKGGNIVIEISEDGRGLDREKIIRRATERNLITSGQELTDQEIYGLIFQAGFSTAEKITDVSGRGVGMDVVKRAVEKMRGKVEIDSVKGRGTTVLIKLPLTLAIIDGISVRAGDRDFIIPTVSVLESIRPQRSAYNRVVNQGEMIKIRGNLHPLIRLHDAFHFEPKHRNPWDAIVVVAESDGRRKCLLVDELVGKQEVVIKSLGEHLKKVKGLAGGAILADGRVGLIIDVAGLFDIGETEAGPEEAPA
jgi:two-component system, chemotaxis family, sensor kinase CheA